MNVNFVACIDMFLDEWNGGMDVVVRRVSKIDRWHMELLDAELLIFVDRTTVFFTRVDDPANSPVGKFRNVSRERNGAKHDMVVDGIPPIAQFQPPTKRYVPQQGRVVNGSSREPFLK